MIYCPQCGFGNRAGSRFCNQCGSTLDDADETAEKTSPRKAKQEPDSAMIQRLRTLSQPSQELAASEPSSSSVPKPTASDERVLSRDREETPLRELSDHSNLPDWLQDVEIEVEPEAEQTWAADIEFTNLPGWLVPEESEQRSEWEIEPAAEEPPIPAEGAGLLAGVSAPLSVEPVITLSHQKPSYPGPVSRSEASVSPFQEITLSVERGASRSTLRGIILLTIVLGLIVLVVIALLLLFTDMNLFRDLLPIGMHLYG